MVEVGADQLAIGDLVAVARDGAPVSIAGGVHERMEASRKLALRIAERGDPVYGLTTAVGVRKRVSVDQLADRAFALRVLTDHRAGQGAPVSTEIARGTMLCLAHGLARGYAGVRPALVERLVTALNAGEAPSIRVFGSSGQGDVVPLAELALAVFDGLELGPKEGIALINTNAFATAIAALAVHDTERLLRDLVTCAAFDLEAYRANLSPLHDAVVASRRFPGVHRAIGELREVLADSALWQPATARNLQDPLSFRNAAEVLGAGFDLVAFAVDQVGRMLDSSQENPLLLVDEDRAISVANYEAQPLAAALDVARIGLVPLLTTQAERTLKLLQASQTGLRDGLAAPGNADESGLSELVWPIQAIAIEAKLLAQPVSVETGSSIQAEGIEDRHTMAPLGGRRLGELVGLGDRLAALAMIVACQAIELRGTALGATLGGVFAAVRGEVAFVGSGETLPESVESLVEAIRSGAASGS